MEEVLLDSPRSRLHHPQSQEWGQPEQDQVQHSPPRQVGQTRWPPEGTAITRTPRLGGPHHSRGDHRRQFCRHLWRGPLYLMSLLWEGGKGRKTVNVKVLKVRLYSIIYNTR